MANRQKIPSAQSGGALLKNPIKNVALAVRDLSGLYDDSEDDTSFILAQTGKNYFDKKKALEDKKNAMEVDRIMSNQRRRLARATRQEDFLAQAQNAQDDLKEEVAKDDGVQDFFIRHSDKLLEANREDIKQLYQLKEREFGKNSLDEMLSLNQNMLSESVYSKGDKLLEQGEEEILSTPFLEENQKEAYRREYLKGGILNLALNDANGALKAVEKYLPDDNEVREAVFKAKSLKEEALKRAEAKKQREDSISQLGDAFSYWQAFEKGQIDEATYFVLSSKNGEEARVSSDNDFGFRAPLSKAYRAIRRLNKKEALSTLEIKEAGNCLINAFKRGEIGLETAGGFQNLVISAGLSSQDAVRLLDVCADELIDSVIGEDALGYGASKDAFMEEKAKFAFDIYEAFYEKKTALSDEFEAMGGTLTESVLQRLGKRAIKEVADDLGLKQATGDVSFAYLEQKIPLYYSGDDVGEIWRKFCRKAPYAEDKEDVLAKICIEQQRAEAKLPRFYCLDEVQRAGLKTGEKFYFQGRLAEIG